MDYAYAVADVVISRAGASSISELCLVGKPSVFVPSPNVAEDHQTKNAMALVNQNAAILVKDIEAKENLVQETLSLIKDEAKQAILKENITKMAFKNSASIIADEVVKLVIRS
ncbi:MAG: UDP-N-acetylglucosamine--N-acetylmuramyl-(pentapeptide) pyrophosphoryl-undecaprenol N-acetylglucosamine transferase, partial [Flavobacteriales bacterium]|nr:UDP-N-acetylglucosamine--N-acetylmuramyl-(pentapeptide) pyrophosphoryl-undecaprenol N-acetylglucosamine transferase [Flavobacteriales bacterium]